MSPAGQGDARDASAGFTLLETICVVAVIAMLASFALPQPLRWTTRSGLEQFAMRAVGVLAADRYAAVKSGAQVTTSLDMGGRVLRSGSSRQTLSLPTDVAVRADIAEDCQSAAGRAGITFHPDGTSCGGVLAFSGHGAGFSVRVSWLTGGVELVADR